MEGMVNVGSRMINRFFLKKFGFNAVVLLQFVDWGDMAEIFLRNVVIIEMPILLQGRFQVASGDERGAFQYLGDATVEAFDHAVGLRMLGFDQSMILLANSVLDRNLI